MERVQATGTRGVNDPEPVSSKLQAARLLFRSAHALEESIDFLNIPFATEMAETLLRAGWESRIRRELNQWRMKIVIAGMALIDDAIREELEAGEATWIAEAVRLRIDGERGDPVTFPLTGPHTEND